ncbi:MAG: DUF1778 domain-containing protein [Symploca sp. SIO3E6]|nr:DUF1778 domain-containing protein [Caldora sp. SIO3E6]
MAKTIDVEEFQTIQIIKDNEFLQLTQRDRSLFAEALLNPPTPSPQAYADAQWYQQVMNK